jgi:hypothetical protein
LDRDSYPLGWTQFPLYPFGGGLNILKTGLNSESVLYSVALPSPLMIPELPVELEEKILKLALQEQREDAKACSLVAMRFYFW